MSTAFAVYRRYYGFVRHALLRARVAEADVDDAVHEVFIVLLRKLGRDADGDDLRAWLFEVSRRIAANRRRAWLRHERKRRVVLPAPDTSTPEDAFARREAARQLADFVASLDPEERSVFRMAEIEGVPGRVIAERLGLQLHTAYRRMRAVRDRFETTFGEPARRSGPLRSLFALPLRWVAPAWAPVLAPAVLAMITMTSSNAATPVANELEPPASPRAVPVSAAIVPAIDEPIEDEIVVLEDEPKPRARRRRPHAAPSAPVAQDEASFAAELPDGFVVQARPLPGAPTPKVGTPVLEPARLAPAAWTGTFVDERGQPLADARVLCRRRTDHGTRRRCWPRGTEPPRTDDSGRVAIRFAPGTYELAAFTEGQLRALDDERVVTIE